MKDSDDEAWLVFKFVLGIMIVCFLWLAGTLVYQVRHHYWMESNKVVEGKFEIPCKLMAVAPHRVSKSTSALTLWLRRIDGNGDFEVVSDKVVTDANATAIVEKIVYRYPDKSGPMINSIFWVTGFFVWLLAALLAGIVMWDWAKFVIKRQREAYPRSQTNLSRREYYWTLFQMAIYDAKRYWKQ